MEILATKISVLNHTLSLFVFCIIPMITIHSVSRAADSNSSLSTQPYIDSLRQENPTHLHSPMTEPSYTQQLQNKLRTNHTDDSTTSYSEQLRTMDTDPHPPAPSGSYTELEKKKLDPKPTSGAIEAVLKGDSELTPKMQGDIHHAFGARYGAALAQQVTLAPTLQSGSFNALYGSNYAPDVSLFYEFQPFHSELYGNLGILGMIGMSYFHGFGQFSTPVQILNTGQYFSSTSSVQFQFYTIPATLAFSYRFNLFKYVRPFAFVGPTTIAYIESRNDTIPGGKGHSEGFLASGGAAISMDWVMPKNSWELYGSFGIQHTYLTLEYSRLTTLRGALNFSAYGLLAGLTFEY